MESAYITRLDNAKFLEEMFSDNPLVVKAAHYLEQAARPHKEALSMVRISSEKIAPFLHETARCEAMAARLLIEAGSSV